METSMQDRPNYSHAVKSKALLFAPPHISILENKANK